MTMGKRLRDSSTFPITSIFRRAAVAAHFDDLGIEAGHDLHQVLLLGHHGVDILVHARHFVRPGG